MRLTVGPLPAAVYWRRRISVLAGVAMVVLVVVYACGGPDASDAGAEEPASPEALAPVPPVTGSMPNEPGSTPSTVTPQPTAFSLPQPRTTGPCADDELSVSASPALAQVQRGQPVDITIRIHNSSGRTCSRDVGANAQELRLLYGDLLVWSSDDCNPSRGTDVRPLQPDEEIQFTVTWEGKRSRTGAAAISCTGPAPEAGGYQLVMRLDKKISAPSELRVVG